MIKAVMFDMDNTLFDYDACALAALRAGFSAFGLGPVPESFYPVFSGITRSMWKDIEFGRMTRSRFSAERFARFFNACGIDADGPEFEKLYAREMFGSSVLEPGADRLLDLLGRKYRLFIASNGETAQQRNRLFRAGILERFEACFISEDLQAYKPSPEYFSACLDIIRSGGAMRPEEVLMVGDSWYADIEGACAAGMKTCYYTAHTSGPVPPGADHVIASLGELAAILL